MGLALDADLVLLVIDAGVSERGVSQTCVWREMRGFSDSRLKWSAKLLKSVLNMEHRVTQISVGWVADLLRLASNAGLHRPASEVFVLLRTRGPHFSSKCNLHVEVRFASDDLSLVIVGQPTSSSSVVFIKLTKLSW